MSADRVERDLAELPDGGGPRAGWEARVLATVRTDTARVAALARPRQRQPLTFALVGAGAVAMASILFFVLRPAPESAKEKAAAAQIEQLMNDIESAQQAFEKAGRETDEKYQKLLEAKTAEEKAKALAALERTKREQAKKHDALKVLRSKAAAAGARKAEPAKQDTKRSVKCDPNDPLCGL